MTDNTIPAWALAAVAPHMGNRDASYYLNGARIEPTATGVALVATNGHTLAAVTLGGIAWTLGPHTIPRDTVLALLKDKAEAVTFAYQDHPEAGEDRDGAASLVASHPSGSRRFLTTGGRFPDWRIVAEAGSGADCAPSALALDVLGPVMDSIKAAGKLLKTRYPAAVFNVLGGEKQAVISPLLPLPEGAAMRFIAMPLRNTVKAPISYAAAPLAGRAGKLS